MKRRHDSESAAWALAGWSVQARHLLEQWSLRQEFPLTAICPLCANAEVDVDRAAVPIIPDWQQVLADPGITGIVLTVPVWQRAEFICQAVEAGKQVFAEGPPGHSQQELERLQALTRGANPGVATFCARRCEVDDRAAEEAVQSRRLGTLTAIRWISCEETIAASFAGDHRQDASEETLFSTGAWLLQRLQQIIPAIPTGVEAWKIPATSGFQARISYAGGLAVWLDIQRSSLCGFRSGWVIEGDRGAYHARRIITRAADGELLEEDWDGDASATENLLDELTRLAADPREFRLSWERSLRTVALLVAIQDSMTRTQAVPFSAWESG